MGYGNIFDRHIVYQEVFIHEQSYFEMVLLCEDSLFLYVSQQGGS